uniref:Uncharacterized protein LOC114338974 n=1 Tax=Diabrotica virgifera virgifera TaxID=50390 RepID=A0A6P7GJL5_DIAVI
MKCREHCDYLVTRRWSMSCLYPSNKNQPRRPLETSLGAGDNPVIIEFDNDSSIFTEKIITEETPVLEATVDHEESKYRHIFNTQFNFGFFVPRKDQCATCHQYFNCTELE